MKMKLVQEMCSLFTNQTSVLSSFVTTICLPCCVEYVYALKVLGTHKGAYKLGFNKNLNVH